jgi:phosphate starvation-inducible PhoH-like protein
LDNSLRRSVLLTGVHLPQFIGPEGHFLTELEADYPELSFRLRDHVLSIEGDAQRVKDAERVVLQSLEIARGGVSDRRPHQRDQALGEPILSARGRVIRPQTAGQRDYVTAMDENTVVFGIGPAGTGKTYLAIAVAVAALQRHEVSKIILTRPAVEAGERLGYLPGSLEEKIDPYLRPLFDALGVMLDPEAVPRMLESGTIEVAPLAYMRGRTLNEAFIILDEAQNTTPEQMKMFLTRLGYDSRMVVTGDRTQIDLPGKNSGLEQAKRVLSHVDDVAFTELSADDVVRNPLVGRIVDAYAAYGDQL